VACAVVRDVAASWEQYLWESEQAWETFRSLRREEVTVAPSASFRPRSTLRGLRPINIVLGADLSTWRPRRANQEKESSESVQ
jgi:hypothetical protein